jgi:leucine dehydrogenase
VDRRRLFRAHGRAVDRLGGRYVTSVDIGTGQEDMPFIAETTRHVTGLPEEMRDPARGTARGVLRAMQGALRHVTGTDDPANRTVAIQGCGHVGHQLASQLRDAGARLVVSDVDVARARRVGAELGAEVVAADEIYEARADVFAPCAVGAVLDDATIPRLRCAIVAGAANNQLGDDRHGQALHDRGILYVPDFIANAGGATFLCIPLAGWSEERMWAHVDRFDQVVAEVLALAGREGLLPHRAAERIAEERLAAGPGNA